MVSITELIPALPMAFIQICQVQLAGLLNCSTQLLKTKSEETFVGRFLDQSKATGWCYNLVMPYYHLLKIELVNMDHTLNRDEPSKHDDNALKKLAK